MYERSVARGRGLKGKRGVENTEQRGKIAQFEEPTEAQYFKKAGSVNILIFRPLVFT